MGIEKCTEEYFFCTFHFFCFSTFYGGINEALIISIIHLYVLER